MGRRREAVYFKMVTSLPISLRPLKVRAEYLARITRSVLNTQGSPIQTAAQPGGRDRQSVSRTTASSNQPIRAMSFSYAAQRCGRF